MIRGKYYGKEVVIDLHNCDKRRFTRRMIRRYFKGLCDLIDMKRAELFWWDDHGLPAAERQTEPHLKGTSAVQFIMTSNITIHTLDIMGRVYVNIFSCKDFESNKAITFTKGFFAGKVVNTKTLIRK